jgi:alpha-ribazole phosphatase
MTRFLLVRHGETVDMETKKLYKGTLDIPLSGEGVKTIERTERFLRGFPIHHVYTSALSRAVESGRIIAEARGLQIDHAAALNEIHFGLWEGLSFDEVREKYPQELKLWYGDPAAHPPPGGEPLVQAQERIMREFGKIAERHRNETILLVAHGGTTRIMICSALGLDLSRLFRIDQENGCVNIIDVHTDGNIVLNLLNYAPGSTC